MIQPNFVHGKEGMPKLLPCFSFVGLLLLRRCEITFDEFIIKIILSKNFNWNQTLKTITRVISLLRNFILHFLNYGMIILGCCILRF
jgi:hypothetical protein